MLEKLHAKVVFERYHVLCLIQCAALVDLVGIPTSFSYDVSGVTGFKKHKEGMNPVSLEISDVHAGDGGRTINRTGSPFQASDIVMTDAGTNRAEDEARWQAGK